MRKQTRDTAIKVIVTMLGVTGFLTMLGCSNSGSGSSGGGNSPVVTGSVLTIDNAGTVPVFGNSSTTTVVYVHNNGTTAISGISYATQLNASKTSSTTSTQLAKLLQSNKNQTGVSGGQCTTIAAGQSCPLSITTPVLTGSNTQGSMVITASYGLNNKTSSFSQIINYARVENNQQTSGAKFQSGTAIAGFGNSVGYATIYLYGSGINQVYDVSAMTINKPAVTIVNGNISGHQIQSNFVQAVEVSSPILSSSIGATITVKSSVATNSTKNTKLKKSLQTDGEFSNSVDLAVEPVSSGAILTTGLVPLINTVNGTSGSMLILNSGNQPAEIGSVSADSGISGLSGCSNSTLTAGSSCTITFNVSEAGGSGNITIPYSGGSAGSVVGNVTWYNGTGAALVSMSAAENPLAFPATVGGSTTVTVTNIGGYTLEEISIPDPVVLGGSATATISSNTCTSSLAINASCTYTVNVTDSATDLNQQINLGFIASYAGSGSQSYSRVMPLVYNSTSYGAIISIDPTDPSLTITGNNNESTTQVLTISNSGNVPANISRALSGNPAYLTESSTTCGATLGAAASCTVTLQFGPTYTASAASGNSLYAVSYTATGQTPSGAESANIAWSVTAVAPSPTTFTVSYNDNNDYFFSGGTGIEDDQYIGFNNITYMINVVYTNTSTTTATNFQSYNSSVAPFVLSERGCTGKTLSQNQSCTDTYTLTVASDSQPTLDLSSVEVGWSDDSGSYQGGIAGAPTIYTSINGSPHIIFVTQNSYNGNLGGLTGASDICNTEAATQGFSGNYKALLDGNNATTNGISYYRSDQRTLIATATGGNLTFITPEDDYSLVNSISTVEGGIAWTGFISGNTCQDWTADSPAFEGIVGLTNANSTDWGIVSSIACSNSNKLYCVQQ